MKSAEFITELFTNPLPYVWDAKRSGLWGGHFIIDSDVRMFVRVEFASHNVRVNDKSVNAVEITFIVNGKFELTGSGHAIEIFSTVAKMFAEYMENHSPEMIVFSSDIDEPSRIKFYNRLAKTIAQKYNYSVLTQNTGIEIEFRLIKQ